MPRPTRKESERQQASKRTAFIREFVSFDASEAREEIAQAHANARKNGEVFADNKNEVPYTVVRHAATEEMNANFAQLLNKCRKGKRSGMSMYPSVGE